MQRSQYNEGVPFSEMTYPDIVIDPLITPQVVRMNDGVADIAIPHGNGNWSDAEATLLMDEKLVRKLVRVGGI